MRIQDAIEEYLAAKHHAVTHDTYVWYSHFLDVFNDWCTANGHHDLSALTIVHVQQFVAATPPTQSAYTRHARAQVVKGFLTWCSLDDEMGVKERTIRRIEMPKVEQSTVDLFTEDDVRRLFRACDKMRTPHRNRAIVHMLLETGVRAAELCYDATRPEEETGLRMSNLIPRSH